MRHGSADREPFLLASRGLTPAGVRPRLAYGKRSSSNS